MTELMYRMRLASVGNPDFGQYAPVSEVETIKGRTIEEIREKCREYQSDWDLGGGNWNPGPLFFGKKRVGYVSYNLRVWKTTKWPTDEVTEFPVSDAPYRPTAYAVMLTVYRMADSEKHQTHEYAVDAEDERGAKKKAREAFAVEHGPFEGAKNDFGPKAEPYYYEYVIREATKETERSTA